MQNISPKSAIMSKVKGKKTDSPAKTQQHISKKKNNTVKKKYWFEHKLKKKKLVSNDQAKVQPPTDSQEFSANWKKLQEILKTSQPEKKPPVTPKYQNGALQKKEAKESSSKNISKNNTGPKQTDAGKTVKHKSVSDKDVPKDAQVNLKVPAASQTTQSTAPTRKRNGGKSNSEQAAKKKKTEVEETKPTENDLWFDDVDPDDIEATLGAEAAEIMRKKQGVQPVRDTESALVKEKAFEGCDAFSCETNGNKPDTPDGLLHRTIWEGFVGAFSNKLGSLTRAVAIDCEMVGVGPDGEDSILARVSLVNQFGKCIYDKYVKPTEKVTDYRTAVSGIRPEDIRNGENVKTVQREVAEILQGRVVVGHAIHNDLKILLLDHPKKKIRDTQKYKPFKKIVKSGRPSLKVLCREILNVKVQQGEHSSVQDAQATMRLYTMVKKNWEAEIKASHKNKDSDKEGQRKPKLPKRKGKNPMGL